MIRLFNLVLNMILFILRKVKKLLYERIVSINLINVKIRKKNKPIISAEAT